MLRKSVDGLRPELSEGFSGLPGRLGREIGSEGVQGRGDVFVLGGGSISCQASAFGTYFQAQATEIHRNQAEPQQRSTPCG